MANLNFDEWFTAVDRRVQAMIMVSVHDLPDMPYLTWYGGGVSPADAARSTVEEALAEYGFDPKDIFEPADELSGERVIPQQTGLKTPLASPKETRDFVSLKTGGGV